MESSIKKDIILNGTDSIAVFKEDGLVYRATDLESYTPIVFNALLANVTYECEIGTLLEKNYKVINTTADFKGDDNLSTISEQNAIGASNSAAYISIVRQGKRVFSQYLQPSYFNNSTSLIVLQPNDLIRITPVSDINALTLYCIPIYLEKPIAIPSLPNNESNNTGDAGTGDTGDGGGGDE